MAKAYEIPNLRFSLPAGGVVERNRFVAATTDGNGIQANATANVIGVSMNKTKAGEVLEIADGIVMVVAGGTVAEGELVSPDADGKAIKATTGTPVAGVAITGGDVNAYITVKIK